MDDLPRVPDAPPPDRILYTIDEAARLTSLSRRTIAKRIAAGDLPVVRIGRAVRIRRATLEAWAVQRENRGGA